MSDAPAATALASRGGKYLTFFLAAEEYGVEILKVREIIGMQPITRVPRTPAFIRGVINLRGTVIPVMDLRERFGMPSAEAAIAALPEAERAAAAAVQCTIVVQVAGAHGRPVPVGVIVDRVSEVALVADADVDDAPSFGAGVRTEYLLGLAKAKTADGRGRVRLLLDLDRVLAADALAELSHAPAAAERADARCGAFRCRGHDRGAVMPRIAWRIGGRF
jgi:purine-binding chemotaxis protein CheW